MGGIFMKYCKFCGEMITEGVEHECQITETTATSDTSSSTTNSAPSSPSTSFISNAQKFLKNPFTALKNGEFVSFNDGLIGIISHIIAYFIWGWALYEEMMEQFVPFLGMFTEGIDLNANNDFLFNFFLLSVVTGAGLLASSFVFGGVFGAKQEFRKSVSVLGTTQYVIALGYLLAAIVCFVSLRFSLALILLIAIVNYVSVFYSSFRLFNIIDEKKVYFILATFAAYLGLLWLFIKIIG